MNKLKIKRINKTFNMDIRKRIREDEKWIMENVLLKMYNGR